MCIRTVSEQLWNIRSIERKPHPLDCVGPPLQAAAAVAAVVATAAVIVMHVDGELFSLRFVFDVLLAVHADGAAVAGVDVGDALATAAVAIAARRQVERQRAMVTV